MSDVIQFLSLLLAGAAAVYAAVVLHRHYRIRAFRDAINAAISAPKAAPKKARLGKSGVKQRKKAQQIVREINRSMAEIKKARGGLDQ